MPYVKSLTDTRIATPIGYIVLVEAGKPQFVPPAALPYAAAQGCVECTKEGDLIIDPKLVAGKLPVGSLPQLSPEDREVPEKRQAVLIQAIAKLYNDADPKTFNAEKQPKVRAVEALIGFPTSGGEVAAALEKYAAST